MAEIPASLSAIEPSWLTDAIRADGHDIPDVTSLDLQPMPGTVGVLGEVGIFTVDYAEETDAPRKLLAKCALDDDIARLYNSIMLFYHREIGFYRDLATEVPLRVPGRWATASDEQRHLLVIDFVDSGEAGDVLEGADLETMRRLLTDIAGLHGKYWMDERIRELPWMFRWDNPQILTGAPIVQAFWNQALEKYPDMVPPDVAQVCWDYHVQDSKWILDHMNARPWTFIHGDYHVDNMIFTDDGGVTVVDWQGCQVSFPAMDVAYLLSTSASEQTLAHEDELLDHYRDELRKAGGPAWSRDELMDDLAWAMVYLVPGELIPFQQDFSGAGEAGQRLEQRFSKCAHETIRAAVRWEMADRLKATGLR